MQIVKHLVHQSPATLPQQQFAINKLKLPAAFVFQSPASTHNYSFSSLCPPFLLNPTACRLFPIFIFVLHHRRNPFPCGINRASITSQFIFMEHYQSRLFQLLSHLRPIYHQKTLCLAHQKQQHSDWEASLFSLQKRRATLLDSSTHLLTQQDILRKQRQAVNIALADQQKKSIAKVEMERQDEEVREKKQFIAALKRDHILLEQRLTLTGRTNEKLIESSTEALLKIVTKQQEEQASLNYLSEQRKNLFRLGQILQRYNGEQQSMNAKIKAVEAEGIVFQERCFTVVCTIANIERERNRNEKSCLEIKEEIANEEREAKKLRKRLAEVRERAEQERKKKKKLEEVICFGKKNVESLGDWTGMRVAVLIPLLGEMRSHMQQAQQFMGSI